MTTKTKYEIVPVKLVIDMDNFEWLLSERLLASGKGETA